MLTAELANNERNVNRNIHKYNVYRYGKMHVSVLILMMYVGGGIDGDNRYGSVRKEKEGGERRGMYMHGWRY